MAKTLQNIDLIKFVKLTDHACVRNDLANFEYEPQTMSKNSSYMIILKLARKTREITLSELIFGDF
jgi:hypothetical protein